jgi:hypothetical protein
MIAMHWPDEASLPNTSNILGNDMKAKWCCRIESHLSQRYTVTIKKAIESSISVISPAYRLGVR